MHLRRVTRFAGLILCLSGLIPVNALATPDLARATATVSARILAPVSVAVIYNATQQAHLRVSHANSLIYQLHIDHSRHHSYALAPSEQGYPLPRPTSQLKLAQNSPAPPSITLYFN